MSLKPTATLLKSFQEEAELQYPNEACGLVVKKGKKQSFMACVNSAESPESHFRIDEDEYARCNDAGEIIAVWHSHPNKTNLPSEFDKIECEDIDLPWFINGITKTDDFGFIFSETYLLEPTGFVMDYVGRPYHYGLVDCYSLLRDYYKREFGVDLAALRHTRDTRFWETNTPMIENHIEGLGFERVYDMPPKKGDVFLIQTGGKVANHVAIYIGDDMILHHCDGRLSTRAIYGGYWQKHTVSHLIHPGVVKHGTDKGNS